MSRAKFAEGDHVRWAFFYAVYCSGGTDGRWGHCEGTICRIKEYPGMTVVLYDVTDVNTNEIHLNIREDALTRLTLLDRLAECAARKTE